jgi:hypothetical protein
MQKGQERIKVLMDKLLIKGEDYGTVKGIDRPFLHQPGAEKLSNFFGFAVRQEADRIVRHEGDSTDVPPFAYHVRSYVHLGDFNGPVVAQGFGEANVYEDRYRWRTERPKCEKCGHELRRGGKAGKLAGLWFCPGFDGGCWWSAPIAHFPPGGKIENPDLWGQAETILLMASKRSLVSAIRRATGTSGFFTQDPEAPSVRQQSEAAGGEATVNEPTVTAGPDIKVSAGARVVPPTQIQLRELTKVTQEQDIKTEALAKLIERLFGIVVDPPTTGNVVKTVKGLTGLQVGTLIQSATTGEVPAEEATPGFPPQSSDEM